MASLAVVPAALAFLALELAASGQAQAGGPDHLSLANASFLDATYLIELKQGSLLSARARSLGNGGFETATGGRVELRDWYSTRWTDASVAWATQVTPSVGIIHGFSTGERGQKYAIAPSLKLGLAMHTQTGRNAFLSFRATTTLGGALKEKPCVADYGEIGGIQAVNCRLAATLLPPAETLGYLVTEAPQHRIQANLVFTWRF